MTFPRRLPRAVAALVPALTLVVSFAGCEHDSKGAGSNDSSAAVDAELPPGDDTEVERIVDGDTLRTTDDVRVRLLNIDSPEPSGDECWASEATDRLESLIPRGTRIRLVYDHERLDRYGRTLAHVYRRSDGMWVNWRLAADGAAFAYVLRPNDTHYAAIRDAADAARQEGRGLWGACSY